MRPGLAVAAALSLACSTTPAVSGGYHLDRQAPAECRRHCSELGLELAAVVVIHSATGCVCDAGQAVARDGVAAVGGTAVVQAVVDDQRVASQAAASVSATTAAGAGR